MSNRRVASTTISQANQIVREGWLIKKGSKKDKIYGDKWQKRWCIIKYKEFLNLHELEYYKTTKDPSPKGVISLTSKCSIVPCNRREFCLSLNTPTREFFFAASSFQEMEDWRQDLDVCIQSCTTTSLPRSVSFQRSSSDEFVPARLSESSDSGGSSLIISQKGLIKDTPSSPATKPEFSYLNIPPEEILWKDIPVLLEEYKAMAKELQKLRIKIQ